MAEEALTSTLDVLENVTDPHNTKFVEIVKALKSKGISALMIPPALIVISPAGGIPGMPAVMGAFLCLISIHMMMNKDQLWLPQRLKKHKFKGEKFLSFIEAIRPHTKKIDAVVKPRLGFLCNEYCTRAIGMICFVLSLLMVGLGFIPFLPMVLAAPILILSLGLLAQDGIIIIGGFAVSIMALIGFFWLVGGVY